MKRSTLGLAALALLASTAARAVTTYDIVETFYEDMTQPKNSIFQGSFSYDSVTHEVSNLQGQLSESMTGTTAANMNWLTLSNQLVWWHDGSLGGTFAAVFKNNNKNTFSNFASGATDFWSPQVGVAAQGLYYGFPFPSANPGNAYALIFVPDNPTAALTQAQLDKLAYADCAPGGMMGAACMTGTSLAGYGAIGTMDGVPLSQTITAAAVPEPESCALMLAGLGLLGGLAHRRSRGG